MAKTIIRFLLFVKPEEVIIVTNKEYFCHVENDIAECEADGVHVISMKYGIDLASKNYLAIFGIKLDSPKTGYGYIETGKN